MKALPLLLALVSLPVLAAAPVALKNEWVEIAAPGSGGEILLSQLRYLPRELHNFREIPQADTIVAFSSEETAQEAGVRVAEVLEDGSIHPLHWKVETASASSIRWRDENGRWSVEAVLEKGPEATLRFTRLNGEATGKLHVSFMLEVAGTFLGVPTEGPADHLIAPLSHPKPNVRIQPIHSNTEATYELHQPWWAVGDRVGKLVFACRASPPAAVSTLHQWSGIITPHEALKETLLLAVGKEPVELHLILCNHLERIAGLSPRAAYAITRDERLSKTELQVVPLRPLEKGVLRVDCQSPVTVPVESWKPGELYKVLLDHPNSGNAFKVELSVDNRTEQALLLPEHAPQP